MKQQLTYRIRLIQYGVVMVMLCLPIIQQCFTIWKVKPLNGAIEQTDTPQFSFANWFEGDFQTSWDAYYNTHFGFRNTAVRLNNQIDYSLFSKAHAKGVIIGKEGYIYEANYVNAYTGKDFVGFTSIAEKLSKLKRVQDTLAKINKHILVVLAPGKASYFPEYIPEKYKSEKNKFTNIEVYRKLLTRYHISYIDFNNWFIQMKPMSKYPLYGKCGIHWSKYAEALVADSLIRFMQTRWRASLANYILDSVRISAQNIDGDYDAGDGLNLLYPINTYPMAYPYFHFTPNNSEKKTKVMVLCDSYYWGLYNYGLSKEVFNGGQFWYYNEEIYSQEFNPSLRVMDADILSEINKHDVIVLMATDANLFRFGFMFIENVYDAFFNHDDQTSTVKKTRIQYFIQLINHDEALLQNCVESSQRNGTTLNDEIKKLAEYKLWEEINLYNGNTTQAK